MPCVTVITDIQAPIETVFDLSRSIEIHEKGQVTKREKAVAGRTTGLIEHGEFVTWEAVHFGIKQQLTSKITLMEKPTHFRDSMVAGAFKRFDHDHIFESQANGITRMIDVFDYTSPLGLLGKLADQLFLIKYMHRLLTERNLVIKQAAEASVRNV